MRTKFMAIVVVASVLMALMISTPVKVFGEEFSADLRSWTVESYPKVSWDPNPYWTVTSDGTSAWQWRNSQPTLMYSDFDALNNKITGTIVVRTSGDDDFIGFAIGFNPGDTTNPEAEYYLIDWKRSSQSWNFQLPSGVVYAARGLAVSRVFGIPTADEFWGHKNFLHNASGEESGLEELARGATLGNKGWAHWQNYLFTFEYTADSLRIYVNGSLEFDLSGDFGAGRFAFYGMSQYNVLYSNFTVTPLFEEVAVDIKPGSCPNPLNVHSNGVLSVAISGTGDLDVFGIDPDSITLEGVMPVRYAREDVSTPFEPFTNKEFSGDCTEDGADGYPDLVLKFDRQEVVQALEEAFGRTLDDGEAVVLTLTGSKKAEFGNTPIFGEDVVLVINKGRK